MIIDPVIGGIIFFVGFYAFFTWKLSFKTASIIMGAMLLTLGIAGGFFGFLPFFN